MSRKKSIVLFFTCLALSFILWPILLNGSVAFLATTISPEKPYPVKTRTIFPTQDSIKSITCDSVASLLQSYIIKADQVWRTSNDKHKADSLITVGFSLIDSLSVNDSILAETYHILGRLLVDKNETKAGIDTLFKTVEIKKRAFGENSPKLSKTYNYIGIGYFHIHDFQNAIKYYKLSIAKQRENKIVNEDLFDSYLNLGILHGSRGLVEQADHFFNDASKVIDSVRPAMDSIRIARFYLNYGAFATSNGALKEANNYLNIAEKIFLSRFGDKYASLAIIYTNKGNIAMFNYNYQQALLYYKSALEINLFNQRFISKVPNSYANLSAAATALKDYSSSIIYCLEGLKYNPSEDTQMLLYQNIAQSLNELGRKEEAQEYYLKALQADKKSSVNPMRSITLNNTYATFLTFNNQIVESKKYYKQALIQAKNHFGDSSSAYAAMLANLGDYFRKHNSNTDSALYYYDKSIAIWNNILNEKEIIFVEINDEIRSIDAYSGKARLLYSLYKMNGDSSLLTESSSLFKVLLKRTDLITKNLGKENSLLLLEILQPVYASAIKVAYDKYKLTGDESAAYEAFDYAERSKSSVLLASIQNNQALKTAEVPDNILELDQQMQSEINGLRKLLADEEKKPVKSSRKISFFNSALLNLMLSHDSLVDEIEKNYPKYYALKYDRSVIDVNSVKNNLEPDEVLVEYVLTDSLLFIFSISKEEQHFERVLLDTAFFNSLYYLIDIKNVDLTQQHGDDFERFVECSQNLFDFLIAPVYENLTDKRLIIIPDGLLGYLSYDLLIKPSVNQFPKLIYQTLPFLLKEFPISYAYSSSLKYNSYFIREKKSRNNLIGFAPIYASTASFGQPRNNTYLKPLPGAESEILDAKMIFGGEAYLNDKATKKNFLKYAPYYRIIHLAMHTLINDSLPMFSELVFTNNDLDSNSYKLHTYEIYGLNLDADMVTLSACNTGTGKLQHGEGIMSLSRGFVYAGVPSIVMTLWDVQDNSSSEIMKKYYTYLQMGYSKDNALRQSKLDFLENTNMLKAHPYYWSAYIITGDASPIIAKRPRNRIELMTGIGIFLLVIVLLIIKIRRK